MEAVEDKKGAQLKYWCFTLPMFPDFWYCDEIVYDVTYVQNKLNNPKVKEWIFNVEKGASGYYHHQGWVMMRAKARLTEVRKIFPNAHWDASRGPAAEAYASKSDTRLYGPYSFPYKYAGEDLINELKPWQGEVRRIISDPPDSRKIHWYYDTKGNVGKTALAKYLCFHYKARLIGGKTADALFAATDGYRVKHPIFIIDIPRAQGNKVPYAALEALKNGLGFSSKYESKQYIGPPAHVIVFSNQVPDLSKLSMDRWVIECLDEPEEVLPPHAVDLIDLLNLPLNI